MNQAILITAGIMAFLIVAGLMFWIWACCKLNADIDQWYEDNLEERRS